MVEYRDDQLGRWEGGGVHTGLGVLGSSVARRGGGGGGGGGRRGAGLWDPSDNGTKDFLTGIGTASPEMDRFPFIQHVTCV